MVSTELLFLQAFSLTVSRIIGQFVFEGTFKGHLDKAPHSEQGHLQLDQVAQSPIQPDLECFQGWGIYHLWAMCFSV